MSEEEQVVAIKEQPLISTPEEAQTRLAEFFTPQVSRDIYGIIPPDIVFKDYSPKEREGLSSIIFATTSPRKKETLAKIAQEVGITVSPTLVEINSESLIRNILREHDVDAESYSEEMVKLKSMPRTDVPMLSVDTIVLDGEEVFEKPIDVTDARRQIRALSGKTAKVRTGIGLQVPGKGGPVPHLFYEELDLRVPIRELSDEEIENYIKESGDMWSVAGGIDYSTELGQSLINPDGEIVLDVRLHQSYFKGNAPERSLRFAKGALPALAPYFEGAPYHPIQGLLSVLKDQSKAVIDF